MDKRNIWHEVTEHKAVYNMAEMAEIHLPYPEAGAKNLFIRDAKKRNYYVITVKGDKRVDLKAFSPVLGISFFLVASLSLLHRILVDQKLLVHIHHLLWSSPVQLHAFI